MRVDVAGGFEDYVRASLTDPESMLQPGRMVRLFAGVDAVRTKNVLEGWLPGEGTQYCGIIEVSGRTLCKAGESGSIIAVSNETGAFERRTLDVPHAVKLFSQIPEDATLLAVGLRLPAENLRCLFPGTQMDGNSLGPLSFVLARRGNRRDQELRIGADEISMEFMWP